MKSRIKVILFFIFIVVIIILGSEVQAAGIDGTTIVINPRTWWKLDRMCKWKQEFNRKRPYFENC